MTHRERKYHKRRYWLRYCRKIMLFTPEQLKQEIALSNKRLHYYATRNGIESSPISTGESVTVQITNTITPTTAAFQKNS